MPIFGAKSRALRGCALKLACGHRIGPYAHSDGLTQKQKILASLTVSGSPLFKGEPFRCGGHSLPKRNCSIISPVRLMWE